ncbi:hypothetical protein D3C73_454930 [compost metagenome]
MSVDDKSVFSYQVAAGSTISAYIGVAVIRKSRATSRSSFPSTSSRQVISSGLSSSFGVARGPSVAPSRCFIKYSCPFAELEIRFDLHTNKERGKFSGASGSSTAYLVSPDTIWFNVCWIISSFVAAPCCEASSAKAKLLLLN